MFSRVLFGVSTSATGDQWRPERESGQVRLVEEGIGIYEGWRGESRGRFRGSHEGKSTVLQWSTLMHISNIAEYRSIFDLHRLVLN